MLSTHILSEAQLTCDRILVINQGQIVAEDTQRDLTERLSEAEVVYVRVRDTSAGVQKELQGLRSVQAVRLEEEAREGAGYYVETKRGLDLRSDVAELAVRKGWGLLELRRMEMTLEDAFIELTREEAPSPS